MQDRKAVSLSPLRFSLFSLFVAYAWPRCLWQPAAV